jgi:uncharacterized RmlC-like cupin family protein
MTATTAVPTVLVAEQVSALPAQPLDAIEGVTNVVLWRSATSMAGVLTVAAGHSLGSHAHRQNHHHMWVLHGTAHIAGADVGPGSYVHVPAGVQHDIAAAADDCVVFYVYEPPA